MDIKISNYLSQLPIKRWFNSASIKFYCNRKLFLTVSIVLFNYNGTHALVVDEIVSRAKSRNKIVRRYRLCNHRACKFDCTIDTSFLALIYKLARHVGKPVKQKARSPPSLTNWAFAEPLNKDETFWSTRGLFRQGSPIQIIIHAATFRNTVLNYSKRLCVSEMTCRRDFNAVNRK